MQREHDDPQITTERNWAYCDDCSANSHEEIWAFEGVLRLNPWRFTTNATTQALFVDAREGVHSRHTLVYAEARQAFITELK